MIAFLYPGQGAQHPGMLSSSSDPTFTATVDSVSELLGHNIRDFDTAQALRDTVATQLALLTVGVAYTRVLADHGIRPDIVAGHSIGAFAAAVAARVLTLDEAVRAVQVRAEGMRDLYPSGFGLLALLGTRLPEARRLVEQASGDGDLFVAMENAEDQIVLAGSDAAFDRAIALAPRFGVREARRLDVAVPSHCALMSPVADSVAHALSAVPVRRPAIRYLSAMTARTAATGERVREDLAGGVAHLVRWRDTTDLLSELGATVVVQLPPGHTTAAMFASAHPGSPVIAIDDARLDDSLVRLERFL
jgi:malonate decarboxylase epsilon subunit